MSGCTPLKPRPGSFTTSRPTTVPDVLALPSSATTHAASLSSASSPTAIQVRALPREVK